MANLKCASAASRRTQAGADSRREVRPGDFSDRVVKRFRRIPSNKAANPNHIGKFASENGTGTKGEMDESSEPIAAGNGGGENNGFGTREAHLVGISPQENRRSATNALGEVEESESKIDGSPTLGSLLLSGTEMQVQEMAPRVGRSLRAP
jgi:hypothetical protein